MRNAENTREKINRRAMALFVKQGVNATTTKDIARAAKIAEGTIYRHYKSKEDLVWQLFVMHYTAMAKRLARLIKDKKDFATALRAVIHECCNLFDEDRIMFSFLLLTQHGQLEKMRKGMSDPVEVVKALASRAIHQKELRLKDPALAASLIFGIVLQPAVFILYGQIEGSMRALAPQLYSACLHALGSPSSSLETS